jgi:hypothetical protein
MINPMPEWLKLSVSKSVVRRALSTALVVGAALAAINYGEAVLDGTLTGAQTVRMALTFCVPYCVSTFSSVRTLQELKRRPIDKA